MKMLFIGLFIVVICKDTKNYGKRAWKTDFFKGKMGFGKRRAPPTGILLPHAGGCQHVQLQILTTSSDRLAAVNRNQINTKCHIVTLLQLGVVIGAPSSSPQGGEPELLESTFIMHYALLIMH
jgi:hypothetical protein